ncbi:type IV pilin [Halomicrobium urmianum]|uniref:type IV pilin n=1 Tax=Halomicrobium urmianum TaxID=1586233 RepID=UPI001CDA2C85|nr:type IV pilin N-terminal domain-containing protein [Halomicrobium urmianum]
MRIKELFERDDAVSPVIGVILMVAITVILAAVIASFVLNLGDQAQQSTPTASFEFEYNPSGNGDQGVVTITHASGDSIDKEKIDVTSDAVTITDNSGGWSASSISAGDTYEATPDSTDNFREGDVIRITWTAESGGSSSTLTTFEVPSDSEGV